MKSREIDKALLGAVLKADKTKVFELLEQGADINTVGSTMDYSVSGNTPLALAVECACRERNENWRTLIGALHQELPGGVKTRKFEEKRQIYLELITELIVAGADINRICNNRSALSIACYWEDEVCAGLLLNAGANPSAENLSPLSRLAIKRGRNVELGYYDTILHEMAAKGCVKLVKMLLVAGADRQRLNHEGKTPAEVARGAGHETVVELLS